MTKHKQTREDGMNSFVLDRARNECDQYGGPALSDRVRADAARQPLDAVVDALWGSELLLEWTEKLYRAGDGCFGRADRRRHRRALLEPTSAG